MLASEISWGSTVAGGRGGTAALAAAVVAALGSVAGTGSSEVRGSVGLGETLWSTGGALGLWAVVPELLLFCRSLRVSRGGGCCFSLQGQRESKEWNRALKCCPAPQKLILGRDVRLQCQVLPSHLLRFWRQRLLQQGLAQQVQVIQATAARRWFGGGCTSICLDWWCCWDRGDTELVAV